MLCCLREELRFLSNGCDVLGNLHDVLLIGLGKGPATSRMATVIVGPSESRDLKP